MNIAVVAAMGVFLSAFFHHPLEAARQDLGKCPISADGEAAQDCPWAGISRALSQEARSSRSVQPALEKLAPELAQQIRAAASFPEIRALWGQSINFDESAKGTIVDPAILDSILEMSGAPLRQDRIVHAGIEHTFGYLFSVLKTSFGYKRARWVSGEIDRGFGFQGPTIAGAPSQGSVFLNVSWLAGQIALRDSAASLRSLERIRKQVPAELAKLQPQSLETVRLVETIQVPRPIEIRTDFVKFPLDSGTRNSHLLIYSIKDSSSSGGLPALITAFPVESSFVDRAVAAQGLGQNQSVQTRYNAFVEGVTGRGWTGTREVARK